MLENCHYNFQWKKNYYTLLLKLRHLQPNIIAVKRAEIIARKRGMLFHEVSARYFSDELWKFGKSNVRFDLWSGNNQFREINEL